MDNDENKLKKRFAELSLRAVEQRRTVSSDFLTLDEQSTLASAQLFSKVYLYGGYPLAERRAALFGEKSEEEKAAECDFVWVKISPVAKSLPTSSLTVISRYAYGTRHQERDNRRYSHG